ncbi:MAG: thioredoxin domain-containing protein [Planctomycetota bacterium]|nr:thioredoxin domain-containing protein [Planctomycetota bacterium]
MRNQWCWRLVVLAVVCIALSYSQGWTPSLEAAEPATRPAGDRPLVNDAYPGLASAGLLGARVSELPAGVLVRAGDLTFTQANLDAEVAKAPPPVQDQLKKNGFFLMEQMVTKALLAKEAGADAGKSVSGMDERALVQGYLGKLAEKVTVSDDEIAEFYKNNKDAVDGAPLEKVKPQIAVYLRQQKQQELVARHVRTLGQRTTIEVAAAWGKEQAVAAKDNPVDKARRSGRPSLVDFGSQGCRPCEMLAPILETLKTKYEGKANVVFVSVREEQILSSRYGIQAIPVQVFFDKDGKEVFRHVGFFPQDEIEKQMAKMGVK